jgi:hypothetical protein
MTELKQLELQTWLNAGNKANTGAAGANAVESQDIFADLGARWSIAPDPTQPTAYPDSYWYLKIGPQNDATLFEYEFDMWLPAAAKPQAIEFEVQQAILGDVANFAWQYNPGAKKWRKFNFGLAGQGAWVDTAVPFAPLAPDSWHNIKATFARTTAELTLHDTLAIDGVETKVGITRPLFREPDANLAKYPDQLSVGWQLDLNPNNGAYSVLTRKMTVRYA